MKINFVGQVYLHVRVELKLMFIYHYVIMTITSGRKSGCMITWPLFVIMKTYPFTPT